jgi:YD repeat-containing protein
MNLNSPLTVKTRIFSSLFIRENWRGVIAATIALSGMSAFHGRGEDATGNDFKLNISQSGNNHDLTWNVPHVVLQTSQTLSGDWVDLPEATSPHTVAGNLDKSFFRLRKVSTISGVEPAFLPTSGGTLYVRGVNFEANSTVTLNGVPAASVTFVDSTLLLVNVAALGAGHYDVAVVNGTSGPAGSTLSKGLTVESTPLASLEVPPGMSEGRTATGEINLTHVDLQIDCPVGPDFVIARTHRSRHDAVGSPFDTAWDFSYNISVAMDGADVVVNDGSGRSDKFFRQPNGTFQRAEFFREGSMNGQVFTLTLADKTTWTFRALNAAVAPGKIDAITDRNGNAMTFSYGVNGRLDQVTDALGRTFQFSYNGSGQLTSVTDFAGRTVTYAYYGTSEPGGSEGDLKSMTSPAVTGTPNGNDFPLGKIITYTYTKGFADERLNHNLTGVIDNTGVQVQTIAYTTELNPAHFDFDRAVSIALGANPPTVFSCEPLTPTPANRYAKTKVTMNDPVGNVSETLYDSKNRPVSIKELTGRATPGLPVTAVGNQPTNKLRASDPAFFETTMAYNLDSQVTQITYPRGNSITMTYASDLSIAAPVRERGNLRQVTQTPAPGVPSDQEQITEKFEYLPGFGTGELPLSHGTGPSNTQAAHGRANFGDMSMVPPGRAIGIPIRPVSTIDFVKIRIDPRGNVWSYDYDAKGNLTSCQAPGIATGDSFEYNAAGQLTAHVHPADANGRRKRDTFNYYSSGTQKGYLQSAVEDAGAGGLALTTTYAYDAVGNVTSVTDPRGNDTQFVFNQLDQLMQVKSAPGGGGVRQQVDFVYSGNKGLLKSGDFDSKASCVRSATALLVNGGENDYNRRFGGNDINRLIIRKDVSNFDENGNPIGDGQLSTLYGRDSIGRLTSVTHEVSDVASTVTQFEYDANGQVTKVLSPLAVSGAAPFSTVQTQYDERGLPFQEISAHGSPDQSTTQYDYDANGNLSRLSEGMEGTPRITTMDNEGFAVSHGRRRMAIGAGRIYDSDCGIGQFFQNQAVLFKNRKGDCALYNAFLVVQDDLPPRGSNLFGGDVKPTFKSGVQFIGSSQGMGIFGGCPITSSGPGGSANLATLPSKAAGGYEQLQSYVGLLNTPIILRPRGGGTGPITVDGLVANNLRVWLVERDMVQRNGLNLSTIPKTKLSLLGEAGTPAPAKITDPLGNVTTFHYDASGSCTSVVHRGELNDVPGGAGNVTLGQADFTYDSRGLTNRDSLWNFHVWNESFVSQEASNTSYADNGQIMAITNARGQGTTFTYDTVGRLSRVTDPKGNSTAYGYDANGNVTTVTDTLKSDLGNPDLVFTKNFTYDKLNRCTSATDNVGNTESFAYDSRGNVVRTIDARGNVSQFAYDGLGRLTRSGRDMNNNGSTQDPVDIVTTQSWDANSRLSTKTDPNGNVTSYGYDSLNRLTQTTAADGTVSSATYDVHGNVVSSTDANGTVTTCNYDLNNRLLQKTIVPAVGVATTTSLETFAYDGLGRVTQANNNSSTTSFTYDSLGRTLTETQNGLTVTSTYDAAGNRLTVAYPGGRTLGYAYDAANLPTTVSLLASSDGEAPGVLSTNHYIGGQLERVVNRNNTRISYSYNGAVGEANAPGDFGWKQVKNMNYDPDLSSAVIGNITFTYDAAQNQTGKTTSFPGKVTAKAYQYDAADRLVNTVVTTNGAQTANITYTLDKAGNRLNVTGDNHPGAYTLDNTLPEPADFQVNQYTTTPVGNFSYDKNGNRTAETSGATTLRAFSYDYANRLVAINIGSTGTPIAVYGYDALGRCILKGTQSGGTLNTTRFVYDGGDVIEERDGGGNVTASFTHGKTCGHYTQVIWSNSSATGCRIVTSKRNGTNYWPATDAAGSTVALTLDNGSVAERYEYADYGEPAFFNGSGSAISGSAVGNVYLWGGMRYDDESELYHRVYVRSVLWPPIVPYRLDFFDPRTGTDVNPSADLRSDEDGEFKELFHKINRQINKK